MRLQGNGLFPPTSNMKQSMLFYPPSLTMNFKLTIGQNYDVEMGFYQSGFLKMILAGEARLNLCSTQ